MVWTIALVIVVAVVMAKNPALVNKLKGTGESASPLLYIGIGLVVINLAIYSLVPIIWTIMTSNKTSLFVFNLAFGAILYLNTLKGKDKDGKETKETDPTARKIAGVLSVLVVLGFITLGWQYFQRNGLTGKQYEEKAVMYEPVRKEQVLHAICMAESNCQHFEADGKTVKRGVIDPDDTGIFQINKRIHADLIKETGLNPEVEADNIKLADILYSRRGTSPWNKSREVWQKLLRKTRLIKPFILGIVEVPTDKWSDEVYNPLLFGTNLAWGRLDRTKGKECQVMLDRDPDKVFPLGENHPELSPSVIQFRCAEPSAQIRVRVVPDK